jgi:hypothetical protein
MPTDPPEPSFLPSVKKGVTVLRRIMVAAIAVLMAVGLSVTTSAPASAYPGRYFWVWGQLNITDYENFGANEHCKVGLNSGKRLAHPAAHSDIFWHHTCGGEIKVQFSLSAEVTQGQYIHMFGQVRFYEGSSIYTNDLDGFRNINLMIRPSPPITSFDVTVRNDDENACDCATYTLYISNSAN